MQNRLSASSITENIWIPSYLFLNSFVVDDRDNSESAVFERCTNLSVACFLFRLVVVWPVDEDADAGPPITFVVEIRLYHDVIGWLVLGEVW